MKRFLSKLFPGDQADVEVNGEAIPQKSTHSLVMGVVIGMMIVAAFFFVLSILQSQTFSKRFLEEVAENQRTVVTISKEEFTPTFSELMVSVRTIWDGGEAPGIFAQMDEVVANSESITAAAKQAENNFPLHKFSSDEQRKIRNYFRVLQQMDSGRHVFVTELEDCIRLTADGDERAQEYCSNISSAWEKKAQSLLTELTATLELTEEDRQLLEGIL